MNFVGKVLVVLQVVLSLCFMAFAGAVYTTHINWKEKHASLEQQLTANLQALQGENADLKQENDRLTKDLQNVENESAVWKARFENANDQLAAVRKQLQDEQDANLREQAVAEIAKLEAAFRKQEADGQRKRNDRLLDSRDQLVSKVRNLEDKLFSRETELNRIVERYNQLLEQNHLFRSILLTNGMSTDPRDYADQQPPPPEVEGVVLDTLRSQRSGSYLIKISIGSDDGLQVGHELYAYRMKDKGKYLGKLRIISVTPDEAVATMDGPAVNGSIQRGDHVATKL